MKTDIRSLNIKKRLWFFVAVIHLVSAAIGQDAAQLDPGDYHTNRQALSNTQIKIEVEQKARVAFLGGSITFNPGWRTKTVAYLQDRYPDTEFDFVHAGIPSMGSVSGAFRIRDDVFMQGKVDLLFVEAAVNDASIWEDGHMHILGMEGIIRQAKIHNPVINIIMMHFVDPGKMKSYRQNTIPEVIQNHERVAKHYNISTINLAKEVTERIDAGEFTWEEDFKNLHPSPFGQEIYFQSIKHFLEKEWGPAQENNSQTRKPRKIKTPKLPKPIDQSSFVDGKQLPIQGITGSGWSYLPNWKPEDGAGTRSGFVNIPLLEASVPGSTLDYDFTGKAIGLLVPAGPDAGIIEFSIDGNAYQEFDLFTKHSRGLHLPRYFILAHDLPIAAHSIGIRISEKSNPNSKGTACRIQRFLVN